MKSINHSLRFGGSALWCLLALIVPRAMADGPVFPNDLPDPTPDHSRPLIVSQRILALPSLTPSPTPASRIRVFRMQPGFLSETSWLDDDRTSGANKTLSLDPEPDPFTLSYGNDNPLFDFRGKGEPGGVGYSRVNSQLQLFDTTKTALSLGLQAVTPAGLAADGLADNRGTTVVTPGCSLYHELDQGLGLQAFVSKNMPLMNRVGAPIRRDVQYGVAIHTSVTNNPVDPLSNLYLSLGALGQQRADGEGGKTINWDVMPGMHLRIADNWWLSGGVLLPVGPNRYENGGHWRLTCQWQF